MIKRHNGFDFFAQDRIETSIKMAEQVKAFPTITYCKRFFLLSIISSVSRAVTVIVFLWDCRISRALHHRNSPRIGRKKTMPGLKAGHQSDKQSRQAVDVYASSEWLLALKNE